MIDPNPNRFLAQYFRALERRESPACVSVEARASGTYEAAQHAQAAYSWAVGVIGTLQRGGAIGAVHIEVGRHFYCSLSTTIVAIIVGRPQGQEHAVTKEIVHMTPGQVPPSCAELESQVDWTAMGEALGLERRVCQRLLRELRAAVEVELQRRVDALRGGEDDEDPQAGLDALQAQVERAMRRMG